MHLVLPKPIPRFQARCEVCIADKFLVRGACVDVLQGCLIVLTSQIYMSAMTHTHHMFLVAYFMTMSVCCKKAVACRHQHVLGILSTLRCML
jgi:hypothetical protein